MSQCRTCAHPVDRCYGCEAPDREARIAELELRVEVVVAAKNQAEGRVRELEVENEMMGIGLDGMRNSLARMSDDLGRANRRVAELEAALRDILKLTSSDEMGILDRVELIAYNAIRTQSAPSVCNEQTSGATRAQALGGTEDGKGPVPLGALPEHPTPPARGPEEAGTFPRPSEAFYIEQSDGKRRPCEIRGLAGARKKSA